MKKYPYKIFLDLDGVLVDFVSKAIEDLTSNISNPPLHLIKFCNLASTSLNDKQIERDDLLSNQHLRNLLFKLIKNNVDFWENLNWVIGGKQLWEFLKEYDVNILSAPVDYCSELGKRKWVEKHLHIPQHKIILRGDKYYHSLNVDGTPNLLIDDTEKKIKQFKEHGGLGILHITGNYIKTIEQFRQYE